MKKNRFSKTITFIVLITLIVTWNTGMSLAGNITYPNSQNLIEKISHPGNGEKEADGILPSEGDRANSYAWTLAQLGDNVYLGSNRNILPSAMQQGIGNKLEKELMLKFLSDISEGDIPTDNLQDMAARMFRYNLTSKTFEEIYKNPAYTGYRGALTFKPEGADKPSVYFGTMGPVSKVLRFDEGFKAGDTPEVVYAAPPGYASIRAMTQHNGTMCIGVLTIDPGVYNVRDDVKATAAEESSGNLQILQATDPAIDTDTTDGDINANIATDKDTEIVKDTTKHWTEIASISDFAACNPRTDAGAAAQSGIWDMISYNGSLYAFIGSGYDSDKKLSENGYCVYKGTYIPTDESANKAGWVWKMIVGPSTDAEGASTGAIYPRGMGNPYDGSASPFLYTDPSGHTYVYVGTFDSIFESIFDILENQGSYESLYHAMHPANIYRFDEKDNWQMVVGNPDQYFSEKLGNYYAGFTTSPALSVYSPNQYVWRMAQYNGELFAGTFDGTTLMDIVVPPLRLDLENYDIHDLLTILKMNEHFLPTKYLDDLTNAVNCVDNASAAAVKAQEVYKDAEAAAEAGETALTAVNGAAEGTAGFVPGDEISTQDSFFGVLTDCKSKVDDFAAKTAAAAEKATAPSINASASAAAASSQKASESAAVAVSAWSDGGSYSDTIRDNIYQVRTDVAAAVDDAHQFSAQAKSDADEMLKKAQEAEAVITAKDGLRDKVIVFNNDFRDLTDTLTADQYEKSLKFITDFEALFYGNNDNKALQEFKYVLALRVMINTNKQAGGMGCSIYRTGDGLNFTPVTVNGFNDKYNYGLRTFLPTSKGLFMGMANPFYGAQLWRLGDLPNNSGGGGGGGGGGGSAVAAATTPAITFGPLNMVDHYAYIQGYDDGTIRPLNNITRAEVATIFYRLMTAESKAKYKTESNDFSDANSGDWFNTAVSTLAKAGILDGYKDGTFLPDAIMTRAEFATIMTRISDMQGGSSSFTDIDVHWAKQYINTAYSNDWIAGYSDNTFHPDQSIARAEVMTIINRALHRAVKASDMLDGMTKWSDNPPGTWYYEAVQEATNSHDYQMTKDLVPGQSFDYEKWTKLTKNSY